MGHSGSGMTHCAFLCPMLNFPEPHPLPGRWAGFPADLKVSRCLGYSLWTMTGDWGLCQGILDLEEARGKSTLKVEFSVWFQMSNLERLASVRILDGLKVEGSRWEGRTNQLKTVKETQPQPPNHRESSYINLRMRLERCNTSQSRVESSVYPYPIPA